MERNFCRKFLLSHHFAENIVANKKYIIQNGRNFLFLRDPSTQTYLTFWTMISESEIHAHIYRLFFKLCKTLFWTYSFRAYCAHMERNFRKIKEVYLKTYYSKITSFTFYISITDLEIQRYHWTPSFHNCWSWMHKERK